MEMGGGWVLEVDIQDFFGSLDHHQLRTFLDQRVRDGVVRRTIDKWLAAGVLEGEELTYPDAGTPQGGVISPLLANIYLHEVVDKWFEKDVKPRLRGRAFMVRFADDLVMAFAAEKDARRVMAVLAKRLAKYGLTLHPDKTRLLCLRPLAGGEPPSPGSRSFDFLGFTHYWARSRRGRWVVQRKTAGSRFRRAVKRIHQWLRINRHQPVAWQHQQLVGKLRGHNNYFGIIGNFRALSRFRLEITRTWRKWLDRRSDKARMSWQRFGNLLRRYPLPAPVIRYRVWDLAANPCR
jgi:group II intron reverse transcriptase/maturase